MSVGFARINKMWRDSLQICLQLCKRGLIYRTGRSDRLIFENGKIVDTARHDERYHHNGDDSFHMLIVPNPPLRGRSVARSPSAQKFGIPSPSNFFGKSRFPKNHCSSMRDGRDTPSHVPAEREGFEAYSFSIPLRFSYGKAARKYRKAFRIPHASKAVCSLLSSFAKLISG